MPSWTVVASAFEFWPWGNIFKVNTFEQGTSAVGHSQFRLFPFWLIYVFTRWNLPWVESCPQNTFSVVSVQCTKLLFDGTDLTIVAVYELILSQCFSVSNSCAIPYIWSYLEISFYNPLPQTPGPSLFTLNVPHVLRTQAENAFATILQEWLLVQFWVFVLSNPVNWSSSTTHTSLSILVVKTTTRLAHLISACSICGLFHPPNPNASVFILE